MPFMKRPNVLASLLLSAAASCVSHDPIERSIGPEEMYRQVLDAETKSPIGRVALAFTWDETVTGLATHYRQCLHVLYAMTDDDGTYTVPKWQGLIPSTIGFYKKGMIPVDGPYRQPGINWLEKSPSTGSKRVSELGLILARTGCPGNEAPNPISKEVSKEALENATTPEEVRWVKSWDRSREKTTR